MKHIKIKNRKTQKSFDMWSYWLQHLLNQVNPKDWKSLHITHQRSLFATFQFARFCVCQWPLNKNYSVRFLFGNIDYYAHIFFPKLYCEIINRNMYIYTSGRGKPLASAPSVVHVNTAAAMADSPDARSLLSASSHLNLMEVDTVRNGFCTFWSLLRLSDRLL